MTGTKFKFDDSDNALADFAKAIALPVRIAIIRMIIKSENGLKKQSLSEIPYNPESIEKHISQLRALGLIKAHGFKGDLTYSIDQDLFSQMANNMIHLLDQSNHKTDY